MTIRQVFISDHAMLRYLERVLEIDVDKLRDKLVKDLSPSIRAGATNAIVDGAKFGFRFDPDTKCAHVTTVLTKSMKSGRKYHRTERKS